MQLHPWHPRVAPWAMYMVFFFLLTMAGRVWVSSYPLFYVAQCVFVIWLLYRYRRLVPELTLRFHWLALPVGLAVAWLWIVMGLWMVDRFPDQFGEAGGEPFFHDDQMGPVVGWFAMALRLVGMSLVVPMFEELFNRSVLLRSFHRHGPVVRGVIQMVLDFPLIGEWLEHTKMGERAGREGAVFGKAFEETPFGTLSVFGVVASTLVFVSVHHPRDWPACFVCGVLYCFVVALTKRHGLGPVIWTHGITNAALWVYTLNQHFTTEEGAKLWRFL